MAPIMARTAEPSVQTNPVQSLGILILIPYLFMIYSRIFDIKFGSLHIPGIMQAFLIILLPASAQALRVLGDKQIGRYLVLFSLWALAIVPFSAWRGGAFQQATQVWPHAVLTFVGIGCMAGSLPGVRRVIYSIGFGIIVLAITAKLFGDLSTGRLRFMSGEFGNSNDLAMALLLGCPFVIYMLMEAGIAIKAVALAGLVPIFWALIHTGSRAGFIGFIVVIVFLFFRCSLVGRLLVLAGGVVVLASALFLLPRMVLERYITLFHSSDTSTEFGGYTPSQMDGATLEASAVASSNARYEILIDSIKMTFKHPITGVGMRNFPVVRDADARAQGRHVAWHDAHNAFTQVSSETGLVGFFLYMAAFIGSIRLLIQLRKFAAAKIHPQWQAISRMVFCLQTSLVSYVVTSFFAPVGYQQFFPTLAGLALAIAYSVQPEFGEWQKQKKQRQVPAPSRVPALSMARA